ncbi:molybdopterin molybdenumtransferase, partial [Klebsiella pneumoniae]
MTGAPVREGCDAVVMQEETEQTEAGGDLYPHHDRRAGAGRLRCGGDAGRD